MPFHPRISQIPASCLLTKAFLQYIAHRMVRLSWQDEMSDVAIEKTEVQRSLPLLYKQGIHRAQQFCS